MKNNQISKKFKYMVATLVAIASMLFMAASPAAALAKASIFGPFAERAVAKGVNDSELSTMFLNDKAEATRLIAEVRQENKQSVRPDLLADEKGAALATTERYLGAVHMDLSKDMTIEPLLTSILSAHVGFKPNGDVINRAEAAFTVSQLEFLLRNGRYWANRANANFTHVNQPR